MSMEEIRKNITDVETTNRILTNVDRLLREATYPGSKHAEVSEGIAFVRHLKRQSESILDQLRQEEKAAKKADKEEESKNETPAA